MENGWALWLDPVEVNQPDQLRVSGKGRVATRRWKERERWREKRNLLGKNVVEVWKTKENAVWKRSVKSMYKIKDLKETI